MKCKNCGLTFTPKKRIRPNRCFALFRKWILGSITTEDLARQKGSLFSCHTLRNHFDRFLAFSPCPQRPRVPSNVYLKADGKYFGRWGCVVVFKTNERVIFWDFIERENYGSYLSFLSQIKGFGYKVLGLTSDWHGSIVSAFTKAFPGKPHQRCLVHTQRFCQSLLTRNPETEAGKNLLELVHLLNGIKTPQEKKIWLAWLERFEFRYASMFNGRTYHQDGKHWWFTHRNLRRAFRTLRTTKEHLFFYLDNPNLSKDTNGLEAEFKHLKQKLSVHKGLKRERKINFIRWYFFLKSEFSN